MRKFRVIPLVILLIALFAGSVFAQETVKFGLVAPFTGLGSILGDYIKEAMMLAVDEINAQGGILGRQIEVIVYDDEASPATAINVVKRVIENDKVLVCFGPNMSSSVLGVHQVALENETPMLVGATSPSLGFDQLGNPWVFRLRADDTVRVENQAEYAVKVLGVKRPGIIYGTTDYCTSARDVIIKKFAEYGIEPVAIEQIREGDKDATGQVLNMIRAGVDSVMGLTHESEAAVFVRQTRQMGLDVPIVGFTAWGVPAFTDLAGEAAIGVIAVQSFTPEDPNPVVQEFVQKYVDRYGRLPSDPGQAYYDGVYVMKEVIERVGSFDKHAIREALENFSGYVGLQGELVNDEKHNLSRFTLISEFLGDSWKIIQKY